VTRLQFTWPSSLAFTSPGTVAIQTEQTEGIRSIGIQKVNAKVLAHGHLEEPRSRGIVASRRPFGLGSLLQPHFVAPQSDTSFQYPLFVTPRSAAK